MAKPYCPLEDRRLLNRSRALVATCLSLAFAASLLAPLPAAAASPKVVIIVGPTGGLTDTYRSQGNAIASAAAAAGANVVKVYSPNATWANVRSAVNNANVIVYLGHGNGFPSPYSNVEDPTRVNGWGLNRTPHNGDSDNWSSTLVYCGEEALLGNLTSADPAQWQYCGGHNGTDGITPAPGFVMIYNSACYAPGAGETADATQAIALARASNYSYPALALGAGASFATDFNAATLVDLILRNRNMGFGEIARRAPGYDFDAQRHFDHPDVPGAEVWIQKTYAMGRRDYWYAYAGDPLRTPAGGTAAAPAAPMVTGTSPAAEALGIATGARVRAFFDVPVFGVSSASFSLHDSYGFRVPATVAWHADLLRATLTPKRPLVPGEWYTARLTEAIHTRAWGELALREWRFQTAAEGGDGVSATWAVTRQLRLGAGTHTGYRFDSAGRLLRARTYTLADTAGPQTSTLRRLPGQSGYWFHVSSGRWESFWLRLSPAVHLAGAPAPTAAVPPATYQPATDLAALRGTHTAYGFDASGTLVAHKTATVPRGTVVRTDQLRALPNQAGAWYRAVNGAFAGLWLRASDVVFLPE
ncbi:MAG TPA: Ig-like domain-containing protein [Candidatus Limnocylindria bacterium]|nr:Ig-like domain-containing protein [Candidatus Limnocylindria bacterium]